MTTRLWNVTEKGTKAPSPCSGTKVSVRWTRSSSGRQPRLLKLVEIEDARMASDVTEVLMGTEVPPRKAFIYEHAQDAELDI